MPAVPPKSIKTLEEFIKFFSDLIDGEMDLPFDDTLYYAERMAILAGSCDGKFVY